jgi:hypothetical protein
MGLNLVRFSLSINVIRLRFSFPLDLRVYVLITSCDPLRVFIYNDGLIHLSTKKYEIPHEKNVVC